MVMLGLRFCARAFSSCGKQGPLFITVCGPLTIAASFVAEHRIQTHRLSNCGSRAQLLHGMWDLPRPGLEPVSPALAGRFSTTAPPGKPRVVHFLLRMNLHWYITTTQSPYFTRGFTLGIVCSMCLDKSIMICIHPYNIIQSIFTVLKILCVLPIHLSLALPPPSHNSVNHCHFYYLHRFAFSRMSYNWNHIVCVLSDQLLSLNNIHLSFLHIVSWLNSSFLFSTEEYSVAWTYYGLFIFSPTEGHLDYFQDLVVMNKVVINIHMQVFVWT